MRKRRNCHIWNILCFSMVFSRTCCVLKVHFKWTKHTFHWHWSEKFLISSTNCIISITVAWKYPTNLKKPRKTCRSYQTWQYLFYQIKEIDIDLSSFTCLQINRGEKRPTTNLIFLASCKKNRYFCIQICSWFLLLLLKNLMQICYFLTPQWQHQQQNCIFRLPKSPFLTFFSTFNGMAFFSTFNVAQIIPFECISYSLNQFHCGIEAIEAFVTKSAYRRLARCAVVFQLRLHLQPNLSHRPY